MKTEHHVYTAKRKVLWEINSKLQEMGDFKYLDIQVIKAPILLENVKDIKTYWPKSYEELIELLKDVDKVYSFNRVETNLHGAIGYDIIIEE